LWSKAVKGVKKAGEITEKAPKKHQKSTEKSRKMANLGEKRHFLWTYFMFFESFIDGFMWVSASFHELTSMTTARNIISKMRWLLVQPKKKFPKPCFSHRFNPPVLSSIGTGNYLKKISENKRGRSVAPRPHILSHRKVPNCLNPITVNTKHHCNK
jgi:hypothetical protein